MKTPLAAVVAALLLCVQTPTAGQAPPLAFPGDGFAVDLDAGSLAEAQAYALRVAIDGAAPVPLAATCAGTASPYACRMDIPSLPAGDHTAVFTTARTVDGVTKVSSASPTLAFRYVLAPPVPREPRVAPSATAPPAPAPAPNPPKTVPEPAISMAQYRLTPGWATFGLAAPQGAVRASRGAQVGALPTQTDVKTTWPDGSLRFAVVTAKVASAGEYAVGEGNNVAAAAADSLTPVWPKAEVVLVVGGEAYVATLPAYPGTDTWLRGQLVSEARVIMSPARAGVPHPLLQVVYDVRAYVGGGYRLDVTVQNVRDVAAGDAVAYDVAVSLEQNVVFQRTGLKQPYLTRWRRTFIGGGLVEAAVTPDFEPAYKAGALPRYLPTVTVAAYAAPEWDVLSPGPLPTDMAQPGGRPDLAPYPNVTAQYLVHKRPDQLAYMLKLGDLSGSYTGHITKADGRSLVTLEEFPGYWLDGRAGLSPAGPSAVRIGDWLRGTSSYIETAHMPSLSFVPYLVTGDRFHLDQAKFWANHAMLVAWPGDGLRQGGKGILAQHQTRGFAWGLRSLADVAAYIPDADPERTYFRSRLQQNLDYLDAYAKTFDGGPLGIVRPIAQADGASVVSLWQNDYLAWAVDRARQHGFGPSEAFITRAVGLHLKFFTGEPGYPRPYASPYYPVVGRKGAFLTSLKDVFDATYRQPDGSLAPPQPWAGYYGPETRLSMLLAAARGLAGAAEALAYTEAQGVLADIAVRAGWALKGAVE